MTKRLYYGSNDLKATVTVLDIGADDRGVFVVLNETIAHVKGGGAKADRGTIGATAFHDVVATDGRNSEVRHYIDHEPAFKIGDLVLMKVDPEWRGIQAAYHNGGHLIAAVVEERYPALKAVSGHHYPGEARVEFTGESSIDLNDITNMLDSALKEAIERDLPVKTVGDSYTDRKIQIGMYPPVPCGGVHPSSTAKLGVLTVKNVKLKNDKLRISYEVQPVV